MLDLSRRRAKGSQEKKAIWKTVEIHIDMSLAHGPKSAWSDTNGSHIPQAELQNAECIASATMHWGSQRDLPSVWTYAVSDDRKSRCTFSLWWQTARRIFRKLGFTQDLHKIRELTRT